MRLAITLSSIDQIGPLSKAGADVFIVGIDGLSQRLKQTYSLDQVKKIIQEVKALNKSIWVSVNAIMHPSMLDDLEETMNTLSSLAIDGILFADLAVFQDAEHYQLTSKLIYYAETYASSKEDAEFWNKETISGMVLARESTLDDIANAANTPDFSVHLIGHGHLNMFHSRRPLVEHYFAYTKDQDYTHLKDKKTLTLEEEIRDERYPIIQDQFGTHVFRAKPLESFSVLDQLKTSVDALIIDTLFIDEHLTISIVNDYHKALHKGVDQALLDQYTSTHDTGFYDRHTVLSKEDQS